MKRYILAAAIFTATSAGALAQETSSPFNASVEMASKYMWRGQEYGTGACLFPTVGYSTGGFSACATGAYTTNGSFQECDLSVGYSWKSLTVSVVDYFYPSEVGLNDKFFNYQNDKTGHALEAELSWNPESLPIWAMAGTYFLGLDKNLEGKQAYSTYLEVGYYHDFTDSDQVAAAIGASVGKGFYTGYEDSFGIVNLSLKYTKTISLGGYEFPVSGTYIINPYLNKTFLTFGVTLGI